MSDWLELELAHELSAVEAPPELWERIARPQRRAVPASKPWVPLAAAAVLVLATVTGAFWLGRSRLDLRQMAAEEMADARPLQFISANPGDINRWLRAKTGLDAALPASHVQIAGARVIERRGVRIGEVAYRSGGQDVVLLVASADSVRAGNRHGQLLWKSRGLAFALACANPNEPKAACLLCHANL